ncbi:MAG: protein kinase [Thermoanaerobaculia bacterium]|nr:protein kinase [Thermoanaerobaculia bacterium]
MNRAEPSEVAISSPGPSSSARTPESTAAWPDAESFAGTERFLVQRRVGSGAFGVVYEAFDRRDRSRVALKVLRSAEADALYRFKKGFRSLADLRHPNLVSFYELITEDGMWFFSMELIDGVEFIEALCGRPECSTDEYERIRRLGWQLAAGLDAVHRSGIVHRDIKPPNVLVTPRDGLKLLDFGLITELRQRPELRSDDHQMVGTPAYMAPEQAHGDLSNPASDWYSVGVMLFQVMTGELPYSGSLMQILTQKLKGPPPDLLRRRVAEVPEDLEELVLGLLRPEPEHRWTAERVLEAFQAGSAGNGTPSTESRANGDGVDLPETRSAATSREGVATRSAENGSLDASRSGGPPTPSRSPTPAPAMVAGRSPLAEESGTVSFSAPFVGRRELLDELHDAVTESRKKPVFARLRGVSGMGKTALLERFLLEIEERAPHAVVLAGRCYVQESVPYKALDSVVDALSRYLMALPTRDVEVLLPTHTAALAQLFPVLLRVKAVAAAPRPTDTETDEGSWTSPQARRRRAFDALRELIARLALRHTLVVVVDDLQWGDVDSFIVLDELFAAGDPPPFLFVGSYRREDTESSAFVSALEERIDSGGWPKVAVQTLRVGELSVDEASELLRRLHGGELSMEHLESVLGEAAGSPLFLSELARHVQTLDEADQVDARRRKRPGGSTAEVHLRDVLRARVEALAAPARRLLEVVAVAGQPLPTAVARRAAGIDAESSAAMADLRTGRFVRLSRLASKLQQAGTEDREQVESYHDRIRETVLDTLSEEELRRQHGLLAEALEASGDADPETLAMHFQATEEADRASCYAVDAARRAENALAFARAARLYRLALDLLPPTSDERYDLEVRLGQALAGAGRSRDAADTFLSAVHHSGRADPVDVQRHAAERLLVSGHIDRGLAVLRHVLRTTGMELETRRWRSLAKLWYLRLRLRLRGLQYETRSEDDIDPESLQRIDVCWSVVVGLCLVDVLHASEFHARHLWLALRSGEAQRIARGLAMEVFFGAMEGGDADEALARARETAGKVEGFYASSLTEMASGMISCSRGRWAEAARRLRRAERHLAETRRGVTWELDTVRQFRTLARLHLGRWNEIFAELPMLMDQARDQDDLYLEVHLHHWVEQLQAVAADRLDEAESSLATSFEGWSHEGFHYQHFGRLVAKTRLLLYRGLGLAAWHEVAQCWPRLQASMIQRIEMVQVQSHDLRARCALAAAASSADIDPMELRSARAVAEADARRLERAGSNWTLGLGRTLHAGLATLEGDRDRVIEHLAVARSAFEAAEMSVHAAIARRRMGQVLGHDVDVRAADDLLRLGNGIVRPDRIADVGAPGRWATVQRSSA